MIFPFKKSQDLRLPQSPFDFMERARRSRVRAVYLFFIGFPLLGMLIATIVAVVEPNLYQATGLVRLRSPISPLRNKNAVKKRAYGDEVALLSTKRFRRSIVPAMPAVQRAKLRTIGVGFRGSAEDLARLQASLPARVPSGVVILNEPGTSLLRISDLGDDPELAAAIVNAVINGANQAGTQIALQYAVKGQHFYLTKLAVLQSKIEDAQAQEALLKPDIADLLSEQSTVVRTAGKTVFIGKQRHVAQPSQATSKAAPDNVKDPFAAEVGESPLDTLKRAEQSADLAEHLAQAKLNLLQTLRTQDDQPLPDAFPDFFLAHLNDNLDHAQADYEAMAVDMGPNQPLLRERLAGIVELRRQIQTATAGRMQNAANAVQASHQQAHAFRVNATEEQARLVKKLSAERNLAILETDLAVNLALFQDVSDQMNRLLITAGLGANRIEVVDLAEVPLKPIPKPFLTNLVYGAGLGLAGAMIALFFLLARTGTLWVPDEIEEATLRGVLAIIPRIKPQLTPQKPSGAPLIISRSTSRREIEAPLLALQAAFRFLFTSDTQRVVAFTSSLPAEGKTTIACTFADLLARSGERVLLIDADTRRPIVNRHFGLLGGQGLSHVLAGAATLEQAVRNIPTETGEPGTLDVLVAGPLAPNPAERIQSSSLQQLLANARATYRYIILDVPSVLNQGGSTSLASLADAVILVARYNQVTIKQITQTRQRLARAGIPISATVVNAVPSSA